MIRNLMILTTTTTTKIEHCEILSNKAIINKQIQDSDLKQLVNVINETKVV